MDVELQRWKQWYAWRPVKIANHPETWVWLNWVWRCKIQGKYRYVFDASPFGRLR